MIRILKYGQDETSVIFARMKPKTDVASIVADILTDVRKNGDSAVFRYCEKFDHAKLERLEVTQEEKDHALKTIEPEFLQVLQQAAENIRHFHSQLQQALMPPFLFHFHCV